MYEDEISENCPHCNNPWDGYECDTCGYAEMLVKNEYETPEGNIVFCSDEQALERGYICHCNCGNIITWWEKEDHGVCIECWHNDR